MQPSLVTAPTGEPLTLAEAKAHLRVDFHDEDAYIDGLIVGARQAFERETGRQLLTASWEWQLDRFPPFSHERIYLPMPPLRSVASVKYVDTSGVEQAWPATEYTVQAFSGPFARRGVLFPKPEKLYPLTRRIPNAVTIDFDAGYGTAADVPAEIKQKLLAWIAHHHENRELVITGTIAAKIPGLDFDPWKDIDFG